MAHGLTGTRRDRLGAFAERFSAAGIAALLFDHRGFGDSAGTPDLFEPGRQLEDAVVAPKRKGFGSVLIEQATGGRAQIEFPEEGVRCTLSLPLK